MLAYRPRPHRICLKQILKIARERTITLSVAGFFGLQLEGSLDFNLLGRQIRGRSVRAFTRAILVPAIIFASASGVCAQEITPSRVFRQTLKVVDAIHALRAAEGVTAAPREPGVQVHKLPIHVYAKCLEVLEKVARYQATLGLAPPKLGQIPIRSVLPAEVLGCAKDVHHELDRARAAMGLAQAETNPPLVTDKVPSDVYESMWRASFLLDGLVGRLSPSFVFRNTRYILSELNLVATALGVELTGDAPEPQLNREPIDVNLLGFMNLYQIASIEREVGMTAVRVPDFPSGTIQSSDVYDTTNTILAELVRIKVRLGVATGRVTMPVQEGVRSPDAHAQMLLIRRHLKTLRSAVQSLDSKSKGKQL